MNLSSQRQNEDLGCNFESYNRGLQMKQNTMKRRSGGDEDELSVSQQSD